RWLPAQAAQRRGYPRDSWRFGSRPRTRIEPLFRDLGNHHPRTLAPPTNQLSQASEGAQRRRHAPTRRAQHTGAFFVRLCLLALCFHCSRLERTELRPQLVYLHVAPMKLDRHFLRLRLVPAKLRPQRIELRVAPLDLCGCLGFEPGDFVAV